MFSPSPPFLTLLLFHGYQMAIADDSADVIRTELEDHKGNLTALQTVIAPPWVSSQSIRSTSDILWSCVLTLTACIYNSLHLNISTKSGQKRRLLQKVKWATIAIIAPEIVVFMAFFQYFEARWLVKELNKKREKRGEEEKSRYPEFDLRYGFFVAMGGLQVSTSDSDSDSDSDDIDSGYRGSNDKSVNRALSTEAVISLAAEGEFLYVPRESIDDRSKADAVKKVLVLFQVLWMVIQCISRKAYGLPLTLLEVHTMVHVVCAFILYLCWFEKPLDVLNPDILDRSSYSDRMNHVLLEDVPRGIYRIRMIKRDLDFPTDTETVDTVLDASILERRSQWLIYTAAFLFPALYGGIHLTAWNSDFPSIPEHVLWKCSCFTSIGIFPAQKIIQKLLFAIGNTFYSNKIINKGINLSYLMSLVGLLIIFIVTRLYIIVEAFISLRSVPIGVYWTPSWLQMIPHI
ncbi:hypothetical protein F4814DRAFT_382936 [Daldinia grandis]|nr:hypothetical protein F4814DRAFT_382936 [Daldinia grandis]